MTRLRDRCCQNCYATVDHDEDACQPTGQLALQRGDQGQAAGARRGPDQEALRIYHRPWISIQQLSKSPPRKCSEIYSRVFSLSICFEKISVSVYGFLIRSTVFRLPFPSYHLSSWRLNWKPFSSLFSIWVLLLLEL